MRDAHRSHEILEVLQPDDASPWGVAPAAGTAGRPRSGRRIVVVGAAVGVALLVAALAFPEPRRDSAPTPVSTSTSTATVGVDGRPAPVPAAGAGFDGQYVLDAPGLRPYSADIASPPGDDGAFQLWAMGGPDRPWLSVQTIAAVRESIALPGAVRRVVGGVELASPARSPGVTMKVVELDGWSALIRAAGISDEEVIEVASQLGVIDGSVVDGNDAIAALGLRPLASAHRPDELIAGAVESMVRYLDPNDEVVTLSVAKVVGDGSVDPREAVLGFFAAGPPTTTLGRTTASLRDSGESIVIWSDSAHWFSLRGRVDAAELAGYSQRMHQVTSAEWRGLVNGLRPDFRLGEYVQLASGVAGGATWRLGIQLASRRGSTVYMWWWSAADGNTITFSEAFGLAGGEVMVDTMVVGGATYVFVAVPSGPNGGSVTARAPDGSTFQIELLRASGDEAIVFGAARVAVPGPYELTPPVG